MEAAFEIAKQIKLRNLSGKIVIDFAGVSEYRYLKNVIEVLEQELQKIMLKARFSVSVAAETWKSSECAAVPPFVTF